MTLTYTHPLDRLDRAFANIVAPIMAFISAFAASFKPEPGSGELEVIPEPEIERPTREQIEARSRETRARLFGDDEPPPPNPPKKEEPPKKDGEKPDPEEGEEDDLDEEEDDDTGLEDGDEDYEADVDAEPKKPEAKPDEEADDTEGGTLAEKQAKINGRKAKKLEIELNETRLTLKAKDDELKEARERLEQFNKVTIDPRSTPEYLELNDAMWADVDAAVADELPASASKLGDHFVPYLKTYMQAAGMKTDDRLKATAGLKAQIVKDLGGFDDPYEDLVAEERVAADTLAKEVLGVLRRNTDRAKAMVTLEAKLNARAKVGRLAYGAAEYERTQASVRPLIDGIGKLDDKVIEDSPYSPDAVISQMVKENPKMAKRLELAKADVLELLLGPKPLTDKEYAELEEQNADIKAIVKARSDKYEAKKQKLLPLLVKGLFAASFTNKTLEAIAKEARQKADEKTDLDVLADIEGKRRAPAAKKAGKKEEKVIPARDRPLAISKHFED